jgi:hypothetical protein
MNTRLKMENGSLYLKQRCFIPVVYHCCYNALLTGEPLWDGQVIIEI